LGKAIVRISPELLREWIPFPYSTDIVGSSSFHGYIDVIVEDPALPDTGNNLRVITPTFRKNVPVEFMDWGSGV
jgi:hypothetical protein